MTRRDELVNAHLPLVASLARRVAAFAPRSVDLSDLIAIGNLALVAAATRYRPATHGGAPFVAYARARIFGAMVDSFRHGAYVDATALSLADVPERAAWDRLEEAIDTGRRLQAVAAAAETLEPRVRSVLARRACGERLHAIGRDIGLHYSRVSQLHTHGVRAIRAAVGAG